MKKHQAGQCLRSAGAGLLLACVGFSYALATSESRGIGAQPRVIGTDCERPPAIFVTDANLGVVVVGTTFTRQILVKFGFKPHRFFFGTMQPSEGLTISDSGTITGILKNQGVERFDVRVEDKADGVNQVTAAKNFFIDAVAAGTDPSLPLRIVNAPELPTAVASEPYAFTIQANGGTPFPKVEGEIVPPYIYQFASEEDFLALPKGLTLNVETGEIFGKPVAPTKNGKPAAFTIIVSDGVGTTAVKTFSLLVLPGTISSEFVATAGNFQLQFGKEGPRDSLKMFIVLNKTELGRNNIRSKDDLNGISFSMNFGGVTLPPQLVKVDAAGKPLAGESALPTKFDKNGSFRFPDVAKGNLPTKGERLEYEVRLNPRSGVLLVKFKNIDVIKGIGANFRSFDDPIIPVNIKIGVPAKAATTTTTTTTTNTTTDPEAGVNFDKTDIVQFVYDRQGAVGKGTARANDKMAPGGLFLITKVQGVERQVDNNRDRLFLRMSGIMKQVGGKIIEFSTTDQVGLLFGDVCLGDFPASTLKRVGERLEFVNEDRRAGLHSFIIDNKKGTIFIDTHGLDPAALFGSDILKAGEPLVMPITITVASPGTVTAAFDGQSSVTLFRKGNAIRNK